MAPEEGYESVPEHAIKTRGYEKNIGLHPGYLRRRIILPAIKEVHRIGRRSPDNRLKRYLTIDVQVQQTGDCEFESDLTRRHCAGAPNHKNG